MYSIRQLIELRNHARALGLWDDVAHWTEELKKLGYED